jgi:integrase
MPRSSYGSGTLFKRGDIWYLSYWVNGRQVQKSSRSTNIHDVKRLRDQLLGKKARGEMINAAAERITCGELLDDLIEHAQENVKESTAKIWKWCIGGEHSALLRKRQSRPANDGNAEALQKNASRRGRSETTCNRELSILRIALNLGRKCTPPKVNALPYFPMVREENVRHGFLTDGQYAKLRDVLPDHLKPLFVTAYFTGIRLGELLAWQWDQVDWKQGFVTLNAEQTKTGHGRAVPILKGAMRNWLAWARHNANGCAWVFNRIGEPIKNFRRAWQTACASAGVPDLKFHDLRRTAVRNMRRAGVPKVVRMRITGHRTDSMERCYNIVDVEDIQTAKALMERSKSE